MWLLNIKDVVQKQKLTLEEFNSEDQVPYAILSHTWGHKQDEVSFEDCQNEGQFPNKAGIEKVSNVCKKASEENFQYIWIDTCCINKNSSSELQEALNSMYRWYQHSTKCYAFLADIRKPDGELGKSRWMTRGWTLQELISPAYMDFYDMDWSFIAKREILAETIAEYTGIHITILRHERALSEFSIAQRMSWAANRHTTRVEDRAYSLFGIFDVHMSLLYGEGSNAFIRLQEELIKKSTDHSILAWDRDIELKESDGHRGSDLPTDRHEWSGYDLFASSPDDFRNCGNVVIRHTEVPKTVELGNKGLQISALI
ncbi:MAG: hypothetical protein Q9157_009094, partial [Trypethelium eluteriae]